MGQHSTRQVGGAAVSLLGGAILASAVLINPWTVDVWGGDRWIDFLDVYRLYFGTAVTLGAAITGLGIGIQRTRGSALPGLTLVITVLGAAVLADRLLLVHFGLPLWQHDAEARFVHRPHAVRMVLGYSRKHIRINSHGYHDEEYPVARPPGELRGLVLGDSVSMGHLLRYEETYAEQLEDLLRARDPGHSSHQIINTAVEGYATAQELVALRRAARFEPAFAVLGFCMNDATEPFLVESKLGGAGVDYHEVKEAPSRLAAHLSNETGVGRLLLWLGRDQRQLDVRKRREEYNVRDASRGARSDPKYARVWERALGELEQLFTAGAELQVPVVLLVFPYTFQLLDDELQQPQQLLTEHARRHGVSVLDFTPIFRELIYDNAELLAALERAGYTRDEIEQIHQWKTNRYFIDTNHLTTTGHEVVARHLLDHLEGQGLLRRQLPEQSGK